MSAESTPTDLLPNKLYWSDLDKEQPCLCGNHVPETWTDFHEIDPFENLQSLPLFCVLCEKLDGTYSETNMYQIMREVFEMRERQKQKLMAEFCIKRKKLIVASSFVLENFNSGRLYTKRNDKQASYCGTHIPNLWRESMKNIVPCSPFEDGLIQLHWCSKCTDRDEFSKNRIEAKAKERMNEVCKFRAVVPQETNSNSNTIEIQSGYIAPPKKKQKTVAFDTEKEVKNKKSRKSNIFLKEDIMEQDDSP